MHIQARFASLGLKGRSPWLGFSVFWGSQGSWRQGLQEPQEIEGELSTC